MLPSLSLSLSLSLYIYIYIYIPIYLTSTHAQTHSRTHTYTQTNKQHIQGDEFNLDVFPDVAIEGDRQQVGGWLSLVCIVTFAYST